MSKRDKYTFTIKCSMCENTAEVECEENENPAYNNWKLNQSKVYPTGWKKRESGYFCPDHSN